MLFYTMSCVSLEAMPSLSLSPSTTCDYPFPSPLIPPIDLSSMVDHRRRVRFVSPLLTTRRHPIADSAPSSTDSALSSLRLGRSETFPVSTSLLHHESVTMKAEDVREFLQRSNSVCDEEEVSSLHTICNFILELLCTP